MQQQHYDCDFICVSLAFQKVEFLEKCSNNVVVVYAYNNNICVSAAFQKLEILEKCSNNTMIVVYRTSIDFICLSSLPKTRNFRKMQQQH